MRALRSAEEFLGKAYNFASVFAAEAQEIAQQCQQRGVDDDLKLDGVPGAPIPDRLGLALSGGGIRSACVALGILQRLARAQILRQVHYISAISGGGYILGFLSAWTKRAKSLDAVESRLGHNTANGQPPKASTLSAYERFLEPEPVHFLRQYSSYLTPRMGLLSGDTLAFLSIYLRNLLLNQLLLASGLVSIVLLLQLIAPSIGWAHPLPTCLIISGIVLVVLFFGIATRMLWQALKDLEQKAPQNENKAEHWSVIGCGVVIAVLVWLITPSWYARGATEQCTLYIVVGVAFLGLVFSLVFGDLKHSVERSRSIGVIALFLAWSVCGFVVCLIDMAFRHWTIHGTTMTISDGYVVLGLPLVLLGVTAASFVFIGILGNAFPDSQREWLARLAGYLLSTAIVCALLLAIAIEGPMLMHLLISGFRQPGWTKPILSSILPGGWFFIVLSGLLKAQGPTTNGGSASSSKGDFVVAIAPPIFLVGLLLLVSWGTHALTVGAKAHPDLSHDYLPSANWCSKVGQTATSHLICWQPTVQGYAIAQTRQSALPPPALSWQQRYFLLWLLTTAITAILAWRLDVNEFSMHLFYRNRLVRAFLGASNVDRAPSPFTGFASTDDIALEDLVTGQGFQGPYPLWGTTLNLTTGENLAWQERKGASFIYSPLFCGWDYVNQTSMPAQPEISMSDDDSAARKRSPRANLYGFRSTLRDNKVPGYGGEGGKPYVGTALAASGAAASPNMGYHTRPGVAALLAIFNVRLGWWTGNPHNPRTWNKYAPGIWYLLNELLGKSSDRDRYVYLSDGGHFDNLGLYELVRRRVRFIICSDADADHAFSFEDLGNAIQRCRRDFGVEIRLQAQQDLSPALIPPYRKAHYAIGEISYPGQQAKGILLYLKSSLTDDEPSDVLSRRAQDNAFPHDTTANQFFTDSAFEAYRALGEHMMNIILKQATLERPRGTPRDDVHTFFHYLRRQV